jgi:uncharacterized protein
MSNAIEHTDRLLAIVREYGSCLVAFSGGVDSAVVAKAARLALGDRAIAGTGVGPAVSDVELSTARKVAADIGIQHVELATTELQQPGYVANATDRCFHCKTELYAVLADYAEQHDFAVIANGTLLDDLGDYRPGLKAAANADVRSPLVECGLDKSAVRELAHHWDLVVWDKPAAPCLASRIAYGQQVTADRLRMVEAAERLLRQLGIRECRVRYHEGDLSRIEVPLDALAKIAEPQVREQLVAELRAIGFRYVTLDLAGFRSGSLNLGLPLLQ